MKITRRQLRSALEREAVRPVPAPSSSFLDALERRVMGDDALVEALAPVPIHRGRRAGIAVAVAVASLAAASVAAALPAMHSGRVFVVPASYDTTMVTTSIAPTTTTLTTEQTATTKQTATSLQTASTESSIPNEAAPVDVASTSTTTITPSTVATTSRGVVRPPVATVATPTPTVAPTTFATEAPTTQLSTTTIAATTTSTSEPSVPASLSIQCAAISTSSIRCTWSQSSDGRLAGYRLLRGVASGPGRVFSTGPGDSGYTDTVPVSGVRYSFLVHAVDASGTSLGHSQLVYVTCCTP